MYAYMHIYAHIHLCMYVCICMYAYMLHVSLMGYVYILTYASLSLSLSPIPSLSVYQSPITIDSFIYRSVSVYLRICFTQVFSRPFPPTDAAHSPLQMSVDCNGRGVAACGWALSWRRPYAAVGVGVHGRMGHGVGGAG